MTPSQRIVLRTSGWGVIVIGLLITFIPYDAQVGYSVWANPSAMGGPWSPLALELNAVPVTLAAIVAVVGIVLVVLSHRLPER